MTHTQLPLAIDHANSLDPDPISPEPTPVTVTSFPEIPALFDIQPSSDKAPDTPFINAWTTYLH